MDLLAAAVANNVHLCQLACGPGRLAAGMWCCDAPPPMFPDAITTARGVDADALVSALPDGPCSVKDSFADVDLAEHGFEVLFAAQWISHPPADPDGGFGRVTGAEALAAWCAAAGLPSTLPSRLIADPLVRCLADDGGGRVLLNRSGDVVGASNVHVPDLDGWRRVVQAAAQHFPGLPVVGYEHGDDLDRALAAGFSALGPLRVWERAGASS